MDPGQAGETGEVADLPEGVQDRMVAEPGSPDGREERRRLRVLAGAELLILGECRDGGGVEREDPLAAGLGRVDRQQPGVQVDAADGNGQGLADPDAGDRDQPEQGGIGRGPEPRAEAAAGGVHPGDVVAGEDERGGPAAIPGEHAPGRDLRGGIDGAQPGREPADGGKPLSPCPRGDSLRQLRPRDRVLRGDDGGAVLLKVAGELRQAMAVVLQPEAECPPQPEVLFGPLVQQGRHDASPSGSAGVPGQGRARGRSRSIPARA